MLSTKVSSSINKIFKIQEVNIMTENQNKDWEIAMAQLTEAGGAVFSNKALRKYFKAKKVIHQASKMHVDLADVYGQIVSSGYYFEQRNKLEEGYFFMSLNNIAEELSLSVSRIRKIIGILCEEELIEVKKVEGEANRFRVNIERFLEITQNIKFANRKYKNKEFEEIPV